MSLTYSLIFKLKPHSVANRGDALAPSFGKPAPDFALPGIDGKTYTLASFVDKKVLVVIFMCNQCQIIGIASILQKVLLRNKRVLRGKHHPFHLLPDAFSPH